jgi:hypothetical protein
MGGFMVSSQDTVLEIGHREQLPMKIAFAKSAAKATAELGFAIGSFIVAIGGFLGLFWVAIVCPEIPLVVVAAFVRDPCHPPDPLATVTRPRAAMCHNRGWILR